MTLNKYADLNNLFQGDTNEIHIFQIKTIRKREK